MHCCVWFVSIQGKKATSRYTKGNQPEPLRAGLPQKRSENNARDKGKTKPKKGCKCPKRGKDGNLIARAGIKIREGK
eukprot:scaffold280257_cov17-Tisochrysis_lutea.AAC.1